MPDIHIERPHTLGLPAARKLAFQWAAEVEQKLDMTCVYEEGETQDEMCFKRSGVNGTLRVTEDAFVLDAKLGFLLGAFKERIEGEIAKNLDVLLASKPAAAKAASRKRKPGKQDV